LVKVHYIKLNKSGLKKKSHTYLCHATKFKVYHTNNHNQLGHVWNPYSNKWGKNNNTAMQRIRTTTTALIVGNASRNHTTRKTMRNGTSEITYLSQGRLVTYITKRLINSTPSFKNAYSLAAKMACSCSNIIT